MMKMVLPLVLLSFLLHPSVPLAVQIPSPLALQIPNGLLPNGDFEKGPAASKLNNTVIMGHHVLPNWTINGQVDYVSVPHGGHAVRLSIGSTLSQTIPVWPGTLYALTISATWTCPSPTGVVLRVSVPPSLGNLVLKNSTGDTYAWAFVASNDNVDVEFENYGPCDLQLNSVAIKRLFVTPEFTESNLLMNGGFEVGPYVLQNATTGIKIPPKEHEDDASPIPGWIIESYYPIRFINKPSFSVPYGNYAVEFVARSGTFISQIINTVPHHHYNLTFVVGDAKNGCHGSMEVQAFAGNETVKVAHTSHDKGTFVSGSLGFRAIHTRTRILFLRSFNHTEDNHHPESLCGPVLDQVRVYPLSSGRS